MKVYRFLVLILICYVCCGASTAAHASELPWSQRAANTAIARWPDGRFVPAEKPWIRNYELGTLLEGMDAVWLNTADPRYFHYIQDSVDRLLGPDGSVPAYKVDEHQLDSILLGRQLLLLYRITLQPKYLKAATLLYDRLMHQPRTHSGAFQYSNRTGLDGLYAAGPFYAEYAGLSHHPEDFSDITHQFVLMEDHARDAKSGLLDDRWNESKRQRWANPATGDSPQFRARGIGLYMMALVDTLGYYPAGDPGRAQLLAILGREAAAVARYQDRTSGLWYQVLDKPSARGNYLESSAACMFVYALAKGVRRGYLPEHDLANAERGYRGVLASFAKTGLGDGPFRDGTYAYSAGERRVSDDPGAVGAFLLASVEMENAQNAKLGRGDVVMVDGWFNSQQRMDGFGKLVTFHYKWDAEDMPGYSLFGHLFREFGAQTAELDAEPTFENLRRAQVFVIASPDNLEKNSRAHFANSADAGQIARWVKSGGVLLMMENDTSFADLEHFNVISERFGIHFNSVLRKHVTGSEWQMGKIAVDGDGPIFHHRHTLYMKDVCTISASGPAKAVLTEGGDIFMAMAKYGKGTVYANVDPWLYNEYTDGRKLPAEYDNFAGGRELVRWVLEQAPHTR